MSLSQVVHRIRKYFRFGVDLISIRLNPERWLSKAGVRFGKGCRFYAIKPGTFGSEPYLVSFGDRVTITDGVRFITHDGGLWIFRHAEPGLELYAPIFIGHRVFIGVNAIILPGAVIGDDSIIAAGAVVKGSFPSRSVIGGVPAKVLGSIDDYLRKNRSRVTTRFHGLKGKERRSALTSHFME